jgi:hypothetical protein
VRQGTAKTLLLMNIRASSPRLFEFFTIAENCVFAHADPSVAGGDQAQFESDGSNYSQQKRRQ